MKATGVIRKIDELGRIVIPKEIRKNLGIRDGENLEIYIEENEIILKKYFEIEKSRELLTKLGEIVNSTFDINLLITDREKYIYGKDVDQEIDNRLISFIDNREVHIDNNNYIVPIISESDSIGLVIIESKDSTNYLNLAKLIAKILADKVNI